MNFQCDGSTWLIFTSMSRREVVFIYMLAFVFYINQINRHIKTVICKQYHWHVWLLLGGWLIFTIMWSCTSYLLQHGCTELSRVVLNFTIIEFPIFIAVYDISTPGLMMLGTFFLKILILLNIIKKEKYCWKSEGDIVRKTMGHMPVIDSIKISIIQQVLNVSLVLCKGMFYSISFFRTSIWIQKQPQLF